MVTRHSTYLISAMFSTLLSSTPEITPRNPETLRRCHEDLSGLDSKGGDRETLIHDIGAKSQDLHGVLGVCW